MQFKRWWCVCAACVLFSCGEQSPEFSDARQSALTVDALNVEPINGQAAHSASQTDISEMLETYRTASFAHATGSVTTVDYSSGNKCSADNLTSNINSFGSGQLTSSTRATTALHVVHNMAALADIQDPQQPQVIRRRAPAVFKFGEWENDDWVYWRATDAQLTPEYRTQLLISNSSFNFAGARGVELPWLSGRLFGLGLDDWAYRSSTSNERTLAANQLRQALRVWNFDADQELYTQPHISIQGDSIVAPDIAFLEAIGTTNLFRRALDDQNVPIVVERYPDVRQQKPDEVTYVFGGGEIPLIRPGMFFGQVPTWNRKVYDGEDDSYRCEYVQSPDESLGDFERQHRLYGTYTNNHVGGAIHATDSYYYRMVANPGYPVIPDDPSPLPWYSDNEPYGSTVGLDCQRVDDVVDSFKLFYEGEHIDATLDAVKGSSGGGVFHATCRDSEGGLKPISGADLVFKGVISQTGGDTETFLGRPIRTQNEIQIEHEFLFTKSRNDELENNDSFFTTTIALLTNENLLWANRDLGGIASSSFFQSDLVPDQPTTSLPTSGCLEMQGETCTKYHGYFAANTAYKDNPGSLYEPVDDDTLRPLGATDSSQDVVDNEVLWDPEAPPNYRNIRLNCFSHAYRTSDTLKAENFRVKGTGFLAGFMGAASTTSLGEASTLSRIDGICAPWSDSSWATNWPFLERLGRGVLSAHASVPGITLAEQLTRASVDHFYAPFSLAASTMAEVRDVTHNSTQHRQVRPASFKTCPPNYYVKGIDFTVYKKGHELEGTVAGITAIHCKVPDAYWEANVQGKFPDVEQEVTVSTVAPISDYSYTLNNVPYDLSAWIGDPRPVDGDPNAPVESAQAVCKDAPNGQPTLASGIIVADSYRTRTTNYLSLLCETEPSL